MSHGSIRRAWLVAIPCLVAWGCGGRKVDNCTQGVALPSEYIERLESIDGRDGGVPDSGSLESADCRRLCPPPHEHSGFPESTAFDCRYQGVTLPSSLPMLECDYRCQ
jgi:hypothetical protein